MKSGSIKNSSLTKKIPGSKISVAVLIDYISEGYSLGEFLADYPWINYRDVKKVLGTLKTERYPLQYAF